MNYLKNIAPYQLSAVDTGVADKQFAVGDVLEMNGKIFTRARVLPGTGGTTGSAFAAVFPSTTGSYTRGDFSFDPSDATLYMQSAFGLAQGSMMTAVTHFMWVQTKGQGPYLVSSTGANIGEPLFAASTDGGLLAKSLISTTINIGYEGAYALEAFGMSTGVTKDIMLLGKYQ